MFAKLSIAILLASAPLFAQFNGMLGNKPILDAHNCYPYEGKWPDRIDRALSTGFPVSIEQDIAWYQGKVVVSHTAKTTGSEPLLTDYFFARVRPIIEKALKENKPETWPVIILHFDFKDTQAPLLHAVWDVLGQYDDWITTAPKGTDPSKLMPLKRGPILVITEDSDEQEQVFFNQLKSGDRLRLFGSAHTLRGKDAHALASLAPSELLTEKPTNYRRWWNNSWYEVEEGGQPKAGEWTAASEARLRSLVDYAHGQGFWVRFYTFDGFKPGQGLGWGEAYNFRSLAAVEKRWLAALKAGVNFIASDQYEDLAEFMRQNHFK